MENIYSIIERARERYPDKVALIYKDKKYTYKDIEESISKIRTFFINNCKSGEIVSLYMENSDAWLLSYFGILGSGCVCNPVGLRTSSENLLYQLRFARPRYLLISDKFVNKFRDLTANKYTKVITLADVLKYKREAKRQPGKFYSNSYATLMYTSGTSGLQKAIRLKHKIIFNATLNIVEYLKIRHTDIYYQILPLSHSFGLGNVHAIFFMGGTVIIADNTINYKKILKDIVRYKATFFAAVPLTLRLIVENYFKEFKAIDKYLRVMCTNTGPMPPDITRKIISDTNNIQFFTYYGLTEASRSSFIWFNLYPDKLASVGRPPAGVKIKLAASAGGVIHEPNKIGEICISGKHVIDGYWKNKEASRKAFRNGWMHTSDMGYYDQDGFLYVVGRDDDIVNIGGEKVSLQEIDNIINKLNFVKDALCLEVPDKRREFSITAYVVLDRKKIRNTSFNSVETEITNHCKNNLDNYKVPQEIIFCESIPKTDSGKIKRAKFRAQIYGTSRRKFNK